MTVRSSFRAALALSTLLIGLAAATTAHSQARAALTRDIDRPTSQPVNGRCQAFANSSGSIKCGLYTVPAGKRLVVETVSYEAVTQSGSVVYQILFGLDAGYSNLISSLPNVYLLNPVLAYDVNGVRDYAATQALKVYFDEGQTVAAGDYHGGGQNYTQSFSFSGYLVDK